MAQNSRPGLQPAVNGSEQRLDLILNELEGLRQDLKDRERAVVVEPGVVELREPAAPEPRARRGKGAR